MYLYHGSIKNIKGFLKPKLAYNFYEEPKIYFSNNKTMALLFGINPIKIYFKNHNINQECGAFSCHIDYKNNTINIYELYNGMFDEIFNNSTFIYTCKIPKTNLGYSKQKPYEYTYSQNCEIYKKEKIINVYDVIKSLVAKKKINLIYHNEILRNEKYKLINAVSSRAYYCSSIEEANFYYDKFGNCCDIIQDIPFKYKRKTKSNSI